jgi:hypothetical protein
MYRFDAPGGQFRVLYVGLDFTAAFVETLLRKPERRIIDLLDLEIRNAAVLTASRPLRLVQAYGTGLSRIGCTAAFRPHATRLRERGRWLCGLTRIKLMDCFTTRVTIPNIYVPPSSTGPSWLLRLYKAIRF